MMPLSASLVLKFSPIRLSPFATMPRKSTATSVPGTLGRPRGCMAAPMKTAAMASSR